MINSAQYLCLSLAFIGECVSLGSAISSTFVFEIPLMGFGQCLLGGGVVSPCSLVGSFARGIHQISFLLLCHVRVAGHDLTLQLTMDHKNL